MIWLNCDYNCYKSCISQFDNDDFLKFYLLEHWSSLIPIDNNNNNNNNNSNNNNNVIATVTIGYLYGYITTILICK
ncbi:unnamed protein product [Schistosoma curassoni]|uniref:Transmembrane protein n=1 Tax=Schistosoma curassoni TaxID=6186 RepID=A0A183K0V8_9TREM|nr:unnamed protein product [Schistosoma curassoni]VDP31693.1 unnamed protein product [Schistosoma curassoni]